MDNKPNAIEVPPYCCKEFSGGVASGKFEHLSSGWTASCSSKYCFYAITEMNYCPYCGERL